MNKTLKINRKKKRYTQEQLARELNITLRQYQNIEYNLVNPNTHTALQLATILNVCPYLLFKNHPCKTNQN